ncbi:hypothetical protein TNCV_1962671 [Trichonephila clavipes]|nr:hypothetical protein TNCV_1962671 [Trichonephila clavipes]
MLGYTSRNRSLIGSETIEDNFTKTQEFYTSGINIFSQQQICSHGEKKAARAWHVSRHLSEIGHFSKQKRADTEARTFQYTLCEQSFPEKERKWHIRTNPDDESMCTLFIGMEASLNSRLLVYEEEKDDKSAALTPAHLLMRQN